MSSSNTTSSWPSVEELWTQFSAAGLMTNPPSGTLADLDWQSYIDAAVGEWETATRCFPYLAETDTREFATNDLSSVLSDPWGATTKRLTIDTGVISVSEVRLFLPTMYGQVDRAGDGILLTEDKDFRLEPVGAPARRVGPYTAMAFNIGHYWASGTTPAIGGEIGILRITGKFGYSDTITPEVRSLVRQLAMGDVAPIVHSNRQAQSGAIVGVKQVIEAKGIRKEVSSNGQTGGAFLLSDSERIRLRRKLNALAASRRQLVLV